MCGKVFPCKHQTKTKITKYNCPNSFFYFKIGWLKYLLKTYFSLQGPADTLAVTLKGRNREKVAHRKGKNMKRSLKTRNIVTEYWRSNESPTYSGKWKGLGLHYVLMDMISIRMATDMKCHRAIYKTDCFWRRLEIYMDEGLLLDMQICNFCSFVCFSFIAVPSIGSQRTGPEQCQHHSGPTRARTLQLNRCASLHGCKSIHIFILFVQPNKTKLNIKHNRIWQQLQYAILIIRTHKN